MRGQRGTSAVGRDYDNRSRAAAALTTQRRIIEAARDLLLEKGYAETTIKDVAATAGVSAETVYKAFGGKAALLKRVYDVLLAGDEAPTALARRPMITAIGQDSDPRSKIARYAAVARVLGDRLGPLLAVLLGARGSDPALDDFARTIDGERLSGASAFVGHLADQRMLREGLDPAIARDLVWTLNSPAVYLMLSERGWSPQRYERWLSGALAETLLGPHPSWINPQS